MLMGLESSQLGTQQWDAIVLSQYDSREAFAHFGATYPHGMKRSALVNLALPMILLGTRVVDLLRGVPADCLNFCLPEERLGEN